MDIPERFAYVEGQNLEDYIHDMRIVQRFASLNRRAMAQTILEGMNLHVADATPSSIYAASFAVCA